MTAQKSGDADKSINWLEWAKVLVVPIVIAATSAILGWYLTNLQNVREERAAADMKARDARESNDRLYAQLTTQREQSDAEIRKDMFSVVINHFLTDPKDTGLKDKVLQLELLASNFNQSLDLAPLFKEMARRMPLEAGLSTQQREDLRKRLDLSASSLIFKQVASLARHGFSKEIQFPLANWEQSVGRPFIDETIPLSLLVPSVASAPVSATDRIHFAVEIIDVNIDQREVEIRLRVNFIGRGGAKFDRHFWVGQYDFPMLDNTQLPNGLRTSVVITEFFVPKGAADRQANSMVTFHLVVFPASSASFKERQDYDDILLGMLLAEGRRAAPEVKPGDAKNPSSK